jgi:hypothetical protein
LSVVGLELVSTPVYQTPQQSVQLFEALAPLRVMRLRELRIHSVELALGSPEVEALAHSLGDSIKVLKFMQCTLQSSFWRPLAQRFPHLRELILGSGVTTSVSDLSFFLTTRSQSRPGSFTIKIHEEALGHTDFAELQAHIDACQLQDVRLLRCTCHDL